MNLVDSCRRRKQLHAKIFAATGQIAGVCFAACVKKRLQQNLSGEFVHPHFAIRFGQLCRQENFLGLKRRKAYILKCIKIKRSTKNKRTRQKTRQKEPNRGKQKESKAKGTSQAKGTKQKEPDT